ncbi:MAG: hypothetical protein V1920_04970, partial [Bacillota bacterium]
IVKRSAKDNSYEYDDIVYSRFGKEIPHPISDFVQMERPQSSGEILNLQISNQLDPIFIVSESGAAVMRHLGRLVNLDLLNETIRNIHRDKLGIQSDIKSCKNRIQQLTTQSEELSEIEYQLEQNRITYEKLMQVRNLYLDNQNKQELVDKMSRNKSSIEELTGRIDSIAHMLIAREEILRLKNMETLEEKIRKVSGKIKELKTMVQQDGAELNNAKQAFENHLKEKGICPLCHRKLDEEHVHAIVSDRHPFSTE